MSGNGCIALYAVDLPNNAASTDLLGRALQNLSARYDTDRAVIDPSVTNPARLVGLVGTLKVKGDATRIVRIGARTSSACRMRL